MFPITARGEWSNRASKRTDARNALTLLELLVVLVILAIVATVAVNSLQPRVESARFDQTRKLIQNIQESVIGVRGSRQTDGTPLISGFLADIGRLPKPEILSGVESETGLELSELWNDQSSLATSYAFRFRSGPRVPVDYSHIQIPCGWRGPYLQLPLGSNNVTDPWGRPFELEFGEGSVIECLNWQPVGDYNTPLKCALKTGKVAVTGTINFGQREPASLEVVLLAPDPDSSLSELAVFADEDSSPGAFAFSNVAVGLRAIHIRFDDQQTTRYIQVPHEGLTMAIELNLPGSSQ